MILFWFYGHCRLWSDHDHWHFSACCCRPYLMNFIVGESLISLILMFVPIRTHHFRWTIISLFFSQMNNEHESKIVWFFDWFYECVVKLQSREVAWECNVLRWVSAYAFWSIWCCLQCDLSRFQAVLGFVVNLSMKCVSEHACKS